MSVEVALAILAFGWAVDRWRLTRIQKNLVNSNRETELQRRMLEHELVFEKNDRREKEKRWEDVQEKMKGTFAELSTNALKSSNERFLELAEQTYLRFHEQTQMRVTQSETRLEALLAPLKEEMHKVDHKILQIEKERTSSQEHLLQQIRGLNDAHRDLRVMSQEIGQALKGPISRGQWGEIQLKRVVEIAGMVAYCDFTEQVSQGHLRPDMIVRLPGGRKVVIDAKAPLAATLKSHVTALSQKNYWASFEGSVDFVVMFLPGEHLLSSALEHDPELLEFAARHHVILATPTTLISLLRSISYGWQQQQVAENAAQIASIGRELVERMGTMATHVNDLGQRLAQANASYEKFTANLETRVMVSARRLEALDIRSSKPLPALNRSAADAHSEP